MFKHSVKSTWAAVRYFIFGLALAVLYAPRKGNESRQMMRNRVMDLFDSVLPTQTTHALDHSVAELDKQEYWESGAAPEQHPVL